VGRNLLIGVPSDWEVVALYYQDVGFTSFLRDLNCRNVRAVRCDLCDPAEVQRTRHETSAEFDVCVYLAANGDPALSVNEPSQDLRQNALALVNLLMNIRAQKLIYFSSGAVYDGSNGEISPLLPVNPSLPYAISKLAAENYVRFFATKAGTVGEYINVRFFGCYGPYEPKRKIYTRLVKTLALQRENRFVIRGDGKNLIDAMYVEDTVDAILCMLRNDKWNLTVDLCGGNAVCIDELVRTAAEVFGISDLEIQYEGTVPEYNKFRASPRIARELFGFSPRTSFADGLHGLLEHLESEQVHMLTETPRPRR
jgi:UDP-glucose 4-epimerase